MPVSTSTTPTACVTAFSNGLPAFLPGGPPSTEDYVGRTPKIPSILDVTLTGGPPNISGALPSYVLSLSQAANNTGTISPPQTGWILFAGDSIEKTVVGRLVQRRQAYKLVAVHYGDQVWATLSAWQQLTAAPPAATGAADYQVRLLSIPGLNLDFFWLASETAGAGDLFIPAPAANGPPSSGLIQPMPIQNFLAMIRPLAANLLNMAAGYGA